MGYTDIDIRVAAECIQIAPLWDTIMVATDPTTGELVCRGEWKMADPAVEPNNAGGIQANNALITAFVLSIFTDKFSTYPRIRGNDPRGWWGDGVDVKNAPPMGSELWTLFNGVLNNQVAAQAAAFVQAACAPLLVKNGGPVARMDIKGEANLPLGRLDIPMSAFSQDGKTIYNQKWQFAWGQINGNGPGTPTFTFT